jgi:hypothetical protein
MHDIRSLETTDDMEKRIDFTDMSEKLIAKTFSLARAFNQTCNVTNFQGAIRRLLRLEEIGENPESRIRYQGNARIGIDGREGIVSRQRAATSERIEDRGLSHVRESNHAATESHSLLPPQPIEK